VREIHLTVPFSLALEPADLGVRADLDLGAVVLTVEGEVELLLPPPSAVGIIMRLIEALHQLRQAGGEIL
jgi:hypothetical protein